METSEIQSRVLQFFEARDVPQTARQLMVGTMSEAAELALCFRFTDNPDPHETGVEALDVVIAALGVMRALGVDVRELFEEKLVAMKKRYPLEQFVNCAEDYVRLHDLA